jgi:predicted extracellular nuclease
MTMKSKILPLALLASGLACGPRSATDDDDGTMPPPGGYTCPASADITVCDLKLAGGQRQPAVGDPINLKGVVVTTPTVAVGFNMNGDPTLAGFYVQDRTTTDELKSRFSGVAVTYASGTLSVPAVGSVVDIEGTYEEFSRNGAAPQRQVKATFISGANGTENVRVVELAIDDVKAEYEGSVIRVPNAVTTMVNPPGVGGMMIFGFQLNNKLIVSTTMARYFSRVGEEFNSITGIYRIGTFTYDAGIYSLSPRTDDDISPKNPLARVTKISAVQDPQSPDRPADMCSSAQQPAERRCPKISLTDVMVTAVDGYVSSNLRAMWVQDPSVSDGRFAGIKVVYGSDETGLPEVGDLVNVEGEVIDWYDGLQIQFPTISAGSGNMAPAPVVVDASMVSRTADPKMNPYEGVLVRIENVRVIERCTEDDMYRDHGNWVVTGDVLIGTSFMYDYNGMLRPSGTQCDNMPNGNCSCSVTSRPGDMRTLDDDFASITGVIDYSFDEFRLNPRGNGDLVLR